MYLLDTVVLSELRRRKPNSNVIAWIDSVAEFDLFLSAITCTEIESGIERQRQSNAPFAEELAYWFEMILRLYGDRILPLSIPIARRWGRLNATLNNRFFDLAIAATALEHRLTVVTRNVTDFAPAGVPTLDPFAWHAARRV